MTTDSKQTPEKKIQVGGVQIAIWKNEGENGPYFKAGSPELRYRDAEGNWNTGRSYSQRDLINLVKAAMMAHSEIGRLDRQNPEDDEQSEAA